MWEESCAESATSARRKRNASLQEIIRIFKNVLSQVLWSFYKKSQICYSHVDKIVLFMDNVIGLMVNCPS